MILDDALFKEPFKAYRVSDESREATEDFHSWELVPVSGPTLAEKYVKPSFEGVFIIPGKIVTVNQPLQDCYLEVVLPERVQEYIYLLREDKVIKVRGRKAGGGTGIPTIPIEKFGVYTMYYAKDNPEVGIGVLRNGLAHAIQKKDIASDLGYVLRDEKRSEEAIEAFQIALSEVLKEEPSDLKSVYVEYLCVELQRLYLLVGDTEKSNELRSLWLSSFEKKSGRKPTAQELPWK